MMNLNRLSLFFGEIAKSTGFPTLATWQVEVDCGTVEVDEKEATLFLGVWVGDNLEGENRED